MVKALNKYSKKLRDIANRRKYINSLPSNYFGEDIFLVSYPKSGNHWLRFLVANAIKVHYNIQSEVNFFTIQGIIPDIGVSRNIATKGCCNVSELPRIIKSHSSYNPYYNRVIFLVRDPRDVMVSYYHYQRSYKSISEKLTISDFIRDKRFGINSWEKHTRSWLFSDDHGHIVKLFRYEAFKENTEKQLYRLMSLLGIQMSESELAKAINLSSKENMRKSEQEHRSDYRLKIQETSVVREAKVLSGKTLSNQDKEFIQNKTKDITDYLGYLYE